VNQFVGVASTNACCRVLLISNIGNNMPHPSASTVPETVEELIMQVTSNPIIQEQVTVFLREQQVCNKLISLKSNFITNCIRSMILVLYAFH
jgi:hypothetical protein